MTRVFHVAAVILLAFASKGVAEETFEQLQKEYDEIDATFVKELKASPSQEEAIRANEKQRKALAEWKEKALASLRKSAEAPESLGVIVSIMRYDGTVVAEMVGLLKEHHVKHPELGKTFHSLADSRTKEGPAFVEEMAEKCPTEVGRGQAAYALGLQARWRILRDGQGSFGFGTKLPEEERKRWQDRAAKYLTLAAEKYPKVAMAYGSGTLGANARAELAGLKNLAHLLVGKVAPDIEGEDLDGKKFKLSDYRGKVTVVVFWASWCGPCMKQVPHEKEMVERLRGKPFALIGVNGDEERENGVKAARTKGMTWPSFWAYAERPEGPIHRAWNLMGWPTIYVLDAGGVIRYVGHEGSKLDELVDKLLAEGEKK